MCAAVPAAAALQPAALPAACSGSGRRSDHAAAAAGARRRQRRAAAASGGGAAGGPRCGPPRGLPTAARPAEPCGAQQAAGSSRCLPLRSLHAARVPGEFPRETLGARCMPAVHMRGMLPPTWALHPQPHPPTTPLQTAAGCAAMQWRTAPGGYLREVLTAKVYDVAVETPLERMDLLRRGPTAV